MLTALSLFLPLIMAGRGGGGAGGHLLDRMIHCERTYKMFKWCKSKHSCRSKNVLKYHTLYVA